MEGSWPKFLAKNILKIILLTIGISMMTFGLMKASPVDPLQANVGQAALGSMSQEQREKLEEYWGVHTPPAQQYISWAKDFVRGDMGISLLYRQPVTEVIGVKLSNSLFLMSAAWVISGILGLFLGVVAGMNRGKLIDKAIQGYCLVISSTPAFWLALLLLLVFGVWLRLFPIGLSVPIGVEASGVTLADRIYHAILPALTLSIIGVSNIALHTRKKWRISWKAIMFCLPGCGGRKDGACLNITGSGTCSCLPLPSSLPPSVRYSEALCLWNRYFPIRVWDRRR